MLNIIIILRLGNVEYSEENWHADYPSIKSSSESLVPASSPSFLILSIGRTVHSARMCGWYLLGLTTILGAVPSQYAGNVTHLASRCEADDHSADGVASGNQ